MNYIFLGNGRVALQILQWLVARGDCPSGLVVHPSHRQQHASEMAAAAGLPGEHVLEGQVLGSSAGSEWIRGHKPEWLVSVMFGYILKPDTLSVPTAGAINMHPALLPYNRGAYPNVWSIVDRTPAGVTIHFMDAGVDTGDVIAQCQVPVLPTDTGVSLYGRLEEASIALFQEAWPRIAQGTFSRTTQPTGGTAHRVSDVEQIDCINPDARVRAADLIDILRARTFPPHKGAYLDLPDRRVYLRVELTEEMK